MSYIDNKLEVPDNFLIKWLEYRLVLHAHESLWNEVLKIKAGFAQKYRAGDAVRSKPYITLVRFRSPAMAQGKLMLELKRLIASFPPFSVEIEDFGSLPSHTIFLQVKSTTLIREMQGRIKKLKHLMKAPEHDPHFIDNPQLVIARKLNPRQYEQAWPELSHTHFKGLFVAEDMQLLCRPVTEGPSAYQTLAVLPLSGMVFTKPLQNVLF